MPLERFDYIDPIVNQQLCDELSPRDIGNWMISLGQETFTCNFRVDDPDQNVGLIPEIRLDWIPYIEFIEEFGSVSLMIQIFEDENIYGLETLIKIGYDPNTIFRINLYENNNKFPTDISPLCLAVKNNWSNGIHFLLENGANPGIGAITIFSGMPVQDDDGKYTFTPLGLAINNKDLELAELLIQHGAPIDQINFGSGSALHLSLTLSDNEVTRFLLEKGADPNVKWHQIPILLDFINDISYTQVKLLLDYGADPNGMTPTFRKTILGNSDYKKAQLLLKNGANPNQTNDEGVTSFQMSMEQKNLKLLKLMLQYGADPNHISLNGKTAIHFTLKYKFYSGLKYLLKIGVDPTVPDDNPTIKLAYDDKSLNLLLDHGVDIDTIFGGALTKLLIAVRYGKAKNVENLLKRGADPNLNFGTPLTHYAIELGEPKKLELLLKYGADPDGQDENGYTPLMVINRKAILSIRMANNMIKMLLRYGANHEPMDRLIIQ